MESFGVCIIADKIDFVNSLIKKINLKIKKINFRSEIGLESVRFGKLWEGIDKMQRLWYDMGSFIMRKDGRHCHEKILPYVYPPRSRSATDPLPASHGDPRGRRRR